jgi:general secretion pathway protein D
MRTSDQNTNIASDRYEYIRGQQIQGRPQPTVVLPDLGTPTVPAMENGRLIDGDLLLLPPGANGIPPRNPAQPVPPVPVPPQQQPLPPMQPVQPQKMQPQPYVPRDMSQ